MKKVLKWAGIVLGSLIVLVLVAAGIMIMSTTGRFNKVYDIQPEAVEISADPESLAIGKHWAEIHCQSCHGPDLAGGPFFEDPSLGHFDAANLTSGEGGVGAVYTDEDWVRALRHGVKKDGHSVFIMPANDFYYLSDKDLGGIIAYVKSVPPVDNTTRTPGLTPFGKILYAMGAFGNLLYAETIQHDVRPPAPAVGKTVEYGEYLVNAHGCKSCHGSELSGDQPAEPGAPLAPNLTPGGELIGWTEADFTNTLRTGVTPSGHELSDSMPWKGFRNLTDDEISTIWLYLTSLPALETTQ